MRLLLDTNILLWLMGSGPELRGQARSLIIDAEQVFVSPISLWEIAIKRQLGKMQEDADLIAEQLESAGLRELPVSHRHALAVGRLPLLHRDPFDRILVAQAMTETMRLLTADRQLAAYSELVITV